MHHLTIKYFRLLSTEQRCFYVPMMIDYGRMIKGIYNAMQFGHRNTQILAVERIFQWQPLLSSDQKIKFDLFLDFHGREQKYNGKII